MDCLDVYYSAKSLQAVARMFQELVRLEFGNLLHEPGAPRVQSTPERQQRFNQTFSRIFPGGQIIGSTPMVRPAGGNATYRVPGGAGNATYRAGGGLGNATYRAGGGAGNATYIAGGSAGNATYRVGGNLAAANNRTFDVLSPPPQRSPGPQLVVDAPTELNVDERLTNSARSLNETVAQLANDEISPPAVAPQNQIFLNVPSQTRATVSARAQRRVPRVSRIPRRLPIQRRIDFM